MIFEVAPGIFDRIQFGSVGWQLIQMDPRILLIPTLDLLPPVSAESVPDQNDVASWKVQLELLKKSHAFGATYVLAGM